MLGLSFLKLRASRIIVLALISANFLYAIQHEMHLFTYASRDKIQYGISAAISSLNYGLRGYLGYNKVSECINPAPDDHTRGWISVNTGLPPTRYIWSGNFAGGDCAGYLNSLITGALNIQDVAAIGIHTLEGTEPGVVDYYKLSFILFGYQYQSFLYFYFLILTTQSLLFLYQFRRDSLLVTLLVLFLLAHYMTLTALQFPGDQLKTPDNPRFLPVLAILPVAHICMLTLQKYKPSVISVLAAVTQAAQLPLITHSRNSALWTLFPITAVTGFAIYHWVRSLRRVPTKNGHSETTEPQIQPIGIRPRLWPTFIALGILFAGQGIYRARLSPVYLEENNVSGHTFWHPLFVGLALHPAILHEYTGQIPNSIKDNLWSSNESFVGNLKNFFFSRASDPGHISDHFSYLAIIKDYQRRGKSPKLIFGENYSLSEDGVAFKPNEVNFRSFDRELQNIVMDVIRKHPVQVLEQIFVYKPAQFTWYYLTCYIPFKYECAFWGGRNTNLITSYSLLLIFLVVSFSVALLWNVPFLGPVPWFLVLLLGSAMIPTLAIFPEPWLIGDAVLVLTLCQLFVVLLVVRAVLKSILLVIKQSTLVR